MDVFTLYERGYSHIAMIFGDAKISMDDDEDLIINKANNSNTQNRNSVSLQLHHIGQSNLNQVGLQLWNVSFLICDYIMYNRHLFENKCILELGM